MNRWVRYYGLAYFMLRHAGWTIEGEIVVPPEKITDDPIIYVKMVRPAAQPRSLTVTNGDNYEDQG